MMNYIVSKAELLFFPQSHMLTICIRDSTYTGRFQILEWAGQKEAHHTVNRHSDLQVNRINIHHQLFAA